MRPITGMRNHSSANHVQIDINKTTLKVLVSLDGRRMIAVFPECAVASFALIVFLATAASDQLHAIGDNLWTGVSNQKVNVVAGHYVIKYGKTEALLRLKNPTQIRLPIARKLQEKTLSMAAVSDVPDVARQEMAVGARHRVR
jgi:hypothetical protein